MQKCQSQNVMKIYREVQMEGNLIQIVLQRKLQQSPHRIVGFGVIDGNNKIGQPHREGLTTSLVLWWCIRAEIQQLLWWAANHLWHIVHCVGIEAEHSKVKARWI